MIFEITDSDDAIVKKFKDSFSFIFTVPKPILLKQTLETCKINEHDTSDLIAVFIQNRQKIRLGRPLNHYLTSPLKTLHCTGKVNLDTRESNFSNY